MTALIAITIIVLSGIALFVLLSGIALYARLMNLGTAVSSSWSEVRIALSEKKDAADASCSKNDPGIESAVLGYNKAVEDYNTAIETFPAQIVARLFHLEKASFYFINNS